MRTTSDFTIAFTVAEPVDTTPPVRSNGAPSGALAAGTTQATLSLSTDEAATCRYATTAGVAYASMPNPFTTTGGTAQATPVTGLVDGGSYSYYVRCQDPAGNASSDDFPISFTVASASSNFSGIESPLSEGGVWDRPGSWSALRKNNGAYSVDLLAQARLVTPTIGADQYSEITYDQDPGTAAWAGVATRVQSASNGSGYLAIAYAGEVRLYRTDDTGSLSFTLLASASASVGTAPRRLRLESQGTNHRVYFNGVQLINYNASGTVYSSGQPGIAASIFGGPTVRILSFATGPLGTTTDTTPPVRSSGAPSGALAAGTTQATLSLSTDETATCRYATTAGVAYASMPNPFTTTGGTAQATTVTGLVNGGSYSYYVRCQDPAGNANSSDFMIAFTVASASTAAATSNFSGIESPLSEGGVWDRPGSWSALRKNNGAYSVDLLAQARLVTPTIGADQYSEITYDQDPGTAAWAGVATRVQSASNGSGYLAIAYAGEVRLYRTDDTGSLSFTLLASASASVGTAPRRLRLESQGTNHRVYFNGVQLINYNASGTVYSSGQPGIAASIFGGPTVRILSFAGGSV